MCTLRVHCDVVRRRAMGVRTQERVEVGGRLSYLVFFVELGGGVGKSKD